jgi:hypothetical protein
VREDIILDRVMKYVACFRVRTFLDRQRYVSARATKRKWKVATQAMDLVYSLSQRSLAGYQQSCWDREGPKPFGGAYGGMLYEPQ